MDIKYLTFLIYKKKKKKIYFNMYENKNLNKALYFMFGFNSNIHSKLYKLRTIIDKENRYKF